MGKVTLQSIADEVGVSRMTVSNAFSRPEKLSADLRERILAVADELGYVGPDPAARALARGRTGTVGLLIPGRLSEQASDPVATEFLVAVADALSDHGLALTLITAGVGGETVPARDVPMDGALVYVCEPDSTDLAWLRRRDLPLVTVDQEALPGRPSINVDDRAGARAAAQHVIDLGHRRVGLLNLHPVQEDSPESTPVDAPWNPPASERDAGWRAALSAAGIEPAVELAAFRPVTAAYDAARRLLERPDRPTALLCFSDGAAGGGVAGAAGARGRLRGRLRRLQPGHGRPPLPHHGEPAGLGQGSPRGRGPAGVDGIVRRRPGAHRAPDLARRARQHCPTPL